MLERQLLKLLEQVKHNETDTLNIWGCKPCTKALIEAVEQGSSLKCLYLRSTGLSRVSFKALAQALQNHKKLNTLWIQYEDFTDEDFEAMMPLLKSVNSLDLFNTGITGISGKLILKALRDGVLMYANVDATGVSEYTRKKVEQLSDNNY